MTQASENNLEKLAAARRRQAYWARRRRVEKLRTTVLLPHKERLTDRQLWREVQEDLHALVDRLDGGASPEMYAWAMKAEEAVWELYTRGSQLELFRASDLLQGTDR